MNSTIGSAEHLRLRAATMRWGELLAHYGETHALAAAQAAIVAAHCDQLAAAIVTVDPDCDAELLALWATQDAYEFAASHGTNADCGLCRTTRALDALEAPNEAATAAT